MEGLREQRDMEQLRRPTVPNAEGYGPSRGKPFAAEAMTVAARKKINAPAAWQVFEWRIMDHTNVEASAIRIRGAVPIGKRKDGRPKWGPVRDADSVFIYSSDVETAKREYEQESGKCADCIEGHYCCGMHVEYGYKYRPCSRCGGDGRPKLSVQRRNDEAI